VTEAVSSVGVREPRAIFAVAVRWDADVGDRLARLQVRLSRRMSPAPSPEPHTAAWTLSLAADDRRGWRKALAAARQLGGPDLGTRVALSWRTLGVPGAAAASDSAAAAASDSGAAAASDSAAAAAAAAAADSRKAGAPEATESTLVAAWSLLDRVRAANRHGTFADAQAHAHFGLPAVHFGDYGWRLHAPRRHTMIWLRGFVGLSLCAGAGGAYLPCLYPKTEAAGAHLWVSVEDAKGQRLKGCAIRAGDHVGLHLQARPSAFGTVLVLSPDGRWSVPHQGLADVAWNARAPEASGWFAVDAGVGQECLYAVSSPTPLGDGRGLERQLNAAASAPSVPESPWLRASYGGARLRSALATLAPGAEVFEATCALSYGR
jgi:hypothetical protein